MDTRTSDGFKDRLAWLKVLVGGPTEESGKAKLSDCVQTIPSDLAQLGNMIINQPESSSGGAIVGVLEDFRFDFESMHVITTQPKV